MDRKALLICSVIGFLGLLSAAAGFAAEATRIKVILIPKYEGGLLILKIKNSGRLAFLF